MWRVLMPTRVVIHSSLVSTIFEHLIVEYVVGEVGGNA